VQILRLKRRIELVVAKTMVQRPTLGARDVIHRAPGVLLRQRSGGRVGEIPQIQPRHVRQPVYRLAAQRRENASLVRVHIRLPRVAG
jgi:hypothetical protein